MLEVLVILALLVVIVGFMFHDRHRPTLGSTRKLLEGGHTPGESLRWSVPALASVVCASTSLLAFLDTGNQREAIASRSRFIQFFLESVLGEDALGYVALALAVIFATIAVSQWRRRNARR